MKLLKRVKKQVALVAALSMALGMQVTTMANDFGGHWAEEVIKEWSELGVVGGYEDGSFKPNNSMTRAEFAVVLSNVFGLVDTDKSISFADVSTNAWYADAVNKVAAAGMMQGANGKFTPSATITRQEVAVALVNAFNLTEKGEANVKFTDEASIAAWAKEQVEIMASKGYVSGRENGNFAPKANITRAEVLKMFDNMTEALLNKAGTYTQDAKGNVIVNTQDVVLKDMTITGDLYLAQGINLGDATLENVTVEGNIFVAGGGVNSIHFNNVKANKGVQVKTAKAVRLVSENSTISATVEAGQNVILTGTFKEVVAQAGATLELKSAKVETITVAGKSADKLELKIDSSSTVKEIIADAVANITGAGKIEKLIANVEGIKSTIRPTTVTGKPVDAPASSGGGGGGSSSGGSGSGSGTVTQKYIEVASIMIDGTEVLNKGISISNNQVTVNMQTLLATAKAAGLEEITSAEVKFSNLNEGDKVTVTTKIPAIKVDATRERTIGENGTVEYSVEQAAAKFEANRERLINKLKDLRAYKHVNTILAKFDLDLENGVYLEDGSINVATLLEKYEQALDYFENADKITAEESVEAIEFFKGMLEDCGGTLSGRTITIGKETAKGALTIQAGTLEAANYSLVIKF